MKMMFLTFQSFIRLYYWFISMPTFYCNVGYFVLPYILKIYSYLSGACYFPELLKALRSVTLENFLYLSS